MKLISLNTWGGRALYPLMRFLNQRSNDTDIFCLQEIFHTDQRTMDELHPEEYVYADLFRKISAALKEFKGFYAYFDDNPHRQSLAMFIRDNVRVEEAGDALMYKPKKPKEYGSHVISSRNIQYVTIHTPDGIRSIINFHGIWTGGSKKDTDERITQSHAVRSYVAKLPGPTILCGDFNILPDTESMRILEEGMRNLVRETNVPSTRTVLYRYFEDKTEPNFADYILVAPGIVVRAFRVLPDIVSDHVPLYLEFS